MRCKRCCEKMEMIDVNLYTCRFCGEIIDVEGDFDDA